MKKEKTLDELNPETPKGSGWIRTGLGDCRVEWMNKDGSFLSIISTRDESGIYLTVDGDRKKLRPLKTLPEAIKYAQTYMSEHKGEYEFGMLIKYPTQKQTLEIEKEITKRAEGREVETWSVIITAKVKYREV